MQVDIVYSNQERIEKAIEEIASQLSFHPDFALFAIHPKYDGVVEAINERFSCAWAGFTALDAFAMQEIVQGVVMCAFSFCRDAKAHLKLFHEHFTLEEVADYFNGNKEQFHIVVATYNGHHTGEFLENLNAYLHYKPINNIIGGIASGDTYNGEFRSFVYTKEGVTKNGGFVLSLENVAFSVAIALGFKPYGVEYVVTKAQENRVYRVDGNRKFSSIAWSLLDGIEKKDIHYLWATPLNILDKQDGQLSTLRTIANIEEEYVELFGPIEEGDRFKLSFADSQELLDADIQGAKEVAKQIDNPDIFFNFSCVARQYLLQERQNEEIVVYTNILKAPLFGFFTFGEIGPDTKNTRLNLYNETSVICGVKEL